MFTGIRFHKSEILVFCLLVSISGCSATGPNSTREIYPSALEAREISEEKKEAADSEEPSSEEATDSEEPSSEEAANSEGNSNLSDFDNPSKLDRKNTDIDLFVGTVTTLEQQSSSKSSAEIDIENNVLREELPKSEETFYIYIPED